MATLRICFDIEIADERIDHDQDGLLDEATRELAVATLQAELGLPDPRVLVFVLCGEQYRGGGYPERCTKDRGHDGDHGTMRA